MDMIFQNEPLTFIGRGAAFNPAEGNTAAYVRENGRLFLIDCGETVFERLMERQILAEVTEVSVALSHLHSDHCGSLGSLVFYCCFVLHCRAQIVLPLAETAFVNSVRNLLAQFGIPDAYYECVDASALSGFRSFSSFQYVKTAHDPRLTCFSFVLETKKGGVFYSADTNRTDELISFLQAHDQIAAIYMEATETDSPGNIHLSLDKLRAALPEKAMEKTRLIHLSSANCMQKAKEMGFSIVSVPNANMKILA